MRDLKESFGQPVSHQAGFEFFGGDVEFVSDYIIDKFKGKNLHFTNGTYAASASMIVPTTLAGFDYINSMANADDVFIVALNSDFSMDTIQALKGASGAIENESDRVEKIALPLINQFPNRRFLFVTYDEDTPIKLYDALAEKGAQLESLHKWGYGTDPNAPKIEGAHNFSKVLAFPLPNDIKPLCHDITAREDQSQFVEVVKLDVSKFVPLAQNLSPETPFNRDL